MCKYGGYGSWILLYIKCIRRCILASFIYEEETRHDSLDLIQSMPALLLFASLYVRSICLQIFLSSTYVLLLSLFSCSRFPTRKKCTERKIQGPSRHPQIMQHPHSRTRILKLFWGPGIDPKESIPSAYVVRRAGTTILFLLGS
jgi:hypothetical protein